MTHAAPRRRRGRHWILPGAMLLAIVALVASGVVSRSIVADFASWWPVWLVLAIGMVLGWRRRVGRIRVAGLVSLMMSLSLVAFAYAHLAAWPILPSALPDLVGPDVSTVERAALSASIEGGRLDVEADETGPLYLVGALRGGGSVGAASATEQQQGRDISVRLSPDESPGLYSYSGWSIGLNPTPVWTLNLGGEIDADLAGLAVSNLQLGGSGSIRLGDASGSTPITVSGEFLISVPDDQPVRVIGPAEIPEAWTRTDVGANSPVEGTGWVISIADGAVVEIVSR